MAELISRAQGAGGIDPVEIEMLRSPRSIERELAHIVSLLTPECQSNGVELRCDVDPRAAQLEAGILAPVLMNGLRNAIESCCRPGLATRRVAVSIHLRTPRSLRLLIEDTGIGLPQSVIVGASPKGDGHGIGLALCRSLVDQSGGQLELSNVPYGGGAVLSVTVDPLALAHRGADAA
jgi:signal transduction histidine kinase